MLNAIMMNFIMMSVIMLSVVMPHNEAYWLVYSFSEHPNSYTQSTLIMKINLLSVALLVAIIDIVLCTDMALQALDHLTGVEYLLKAKRDGCFR